MLDLGKTYWQERWEKGQTGWDIGYPSPAITQYFDDIPNRNVNILIPGCGNAYEGEFLIRNGFKNTFLLDIAPAALENLKNRFPDFPEQNLIQGDFFEHSGAYDFIIEQTFFCALDPALRSRYVDKMLELLSPVGKLVGLLFDDELFSDHPPFGGHKEDYLPLFENSFEILHFERAENSIKPRLGRELFIELRKPMLS